MKQTKISILIYLKSSGRIEKLTKKKNIIHKTLLSTIEKQKAEERG